MVKDTTAHFQIQVMVLEKHEESYILTAFAELVELQ